MFEYLFFRQFTEEIDVEFYFFILVKESDGESQDEDDASDVSSASQKRQNGDTRSSKKRTLGPAAKKGNGE